MKQSLLLLACGPCALIAGCASIGPSTITRDRADYVTSISESWKRQMLQNLVKVRYTDAPVFLDVTSVINAYALDSQISVGGQLAQEGRGDQFATLGGTAGYSDHPTITYAPLTGEKFVRELLTPLSVDSLLYLMQSGFPADAILRIGANAINGLYNAYGGPGAPHAGDAQFAELLTAIRAAQSAGVMGMRRSSAKEPEASVLYFSTPNNAADPSVRRIQDLLNLKPTVREYKVVYGSHPADDTEIAILTRSTLQVLIDFASYIEVPAIDASQGSVYTPNRSAEQERLFPPLMRVHSGEVVPPNAYVSVRYRKQWFWIDDHDLRSKAAFDFLMLMFNLTESGTPQIGAPVVTIPAR